MIARLVLGFTGTRNGMTPHQKLAFGDLLLKLRPVEFHHGDCVGADAEAHNLVRSILPDCPIVIHPPLANVLRAFCPGDLIHEPKGYHERNFDILRASAYLAATPAEMVEQERGGTWSTIRTARTMKSLLGRITVLLPEELQHDIHPPVAGPTA